MAGLVSEKAIRLDGLVELQRAFRLYNRNMHEDFRQAFLVAGEPVRQTGQDLARARLERIDMAKNGIPWWKMRIGFSKGTVWMAPEARGLRGRGRVHPNRRKSNLAFAARLGEEMDAAVEPNLGRIEHELDEALKDLAKAWARV